MSWLLNLLFPCGHKRTTFPLTRSRRTYVVCLDCGAEFDYDWRNMRVGNPIDPPLTAAPVAKEAV